MRIIFLLFSLLLVSICLSGCTDKEPADLVLINGKIITMDPEHPEAQAVAIKSNKIIAVGSEKEILEYTNVNTEVIDLDNKLAVPGLIDAHGHYMSLGESLMGLDLKPAQSWDEIVDMVAEEVKTKKTGEWIMGRGWHQDKWDKTPEPNVDGIPVHKSLSEVSPDNPVILIHVSGHAVFVNEIALKESGILRNTLDPEGGKIVRDKRGNPTGMLRETAQEGARAAFAAFKAKRSDSEIENELRKQVELAANEAISNGITTFHDMGETFKTIDLYKKLADEGNLPVRLYVAIQEPAENLEGKLDQYRMIGYGNNYLTVRMIGEKVLDGALGVHGGWLLEPYNDMPGTNGYNVTPVDDIRRSAELAMKHGYQMAIQGIGDRAARELFDIYENEFITNPDKKDLRWRIEHCQVIHPDDLPRFNSLDVIASIRGIFATSDGPWVQKRLGEARAVERGYLYKSMFESGAVVINGTDPPVEDIDPVQNFYRSVSRMMTNGKVFFPGQRMTRMQTLKSYTVNPAFAGFEEKLKGTIEIGKLADITVFSADIMNVPEDEIPNTSIVYTIIDGKVKYKNK